MKSSGFRVRVFVFEGGAVALLELLAASARAEVVATDLGGRRTNLHLRLTTRRRGRGLFLALRDLAAVTELHRTLLRFVTREVLLLEALDLTFAPASRLAREQCLQSDHCFDALVCAYTAYLWAKDGWELPEADRQVFVEDGWIWSPAGR